MTARGADLRKIAAEPGDEETDLVDVAKAIIDLDDLVRLLRGGLARTKPWQRHLAAHLVDVDELLQILRMTIMMERADDEIEQAARTLVQACRQTVASMTGSRADQVTLAAVRLAARLADAIPGALGRQRAVTEEGGP